MEFRDIKLANGASLLLVPRKDTEVITLLVYIGTGSRYENSDIAGISHFLEHLFFNGSKKRPTALDISKEIDGLGASFNAFTGEELTYFYIKAAAEYLDKTVDILSDMLLNSKFAPEEISKEKKVIKEEIKMYEDMPIELVNDVFGEGIFAGNGLSRRILGTNKSISALDRNKIINYKNSYYQGKKINICLAGNFGSRSTAEISRLIEEKFVFPRGVEKEKTSAVFQQKRFNYLARETSQMNLIAGFYAPSFSDEQRTAARLLSIILGGNMSSRMFQEIREKKGLAYFIRTIYHPFSDSGFIATHAGIANDKAQEALRLILAEYQKIKDNLTQKEIEKAKNYLIGQIKINLEDSQEIGYFYLNQLFYLGKMKTPGEYFAEVAEVTKEELAALAEKYLAAEKLTVAAIGPKSVKDDIEKIINSKKER